MNCKYKRGKNGKSTNVKYDKIRRKEAWIKHLEQRKTQTPTIPNEEQIQLIKFWIENTTYTKQALEMIIDFHSKHEWKQTEVIKPKRHLS